MIDVIYYDSVTFLEELLYDCSPNEDLHLMINSPGGVGEVAVRLARSAQSRCRELTIIVPDQAKSAATLLAVGGHQIIMAPAGDLGPVDPQFFHGRGWVAAKDIIAAVEDALQRVEQSPATYPVHVSLLGDVTAVMVQQPDLLWAAQKICSEKHCVAIPIGRITKSNNLWMRFVVL